MPLSNDGDRITISVGFEKSELPTEFETFATQSEKNGKMYVKLKVFPKFCKCYSATAKEFAFPKNKDLDGQMFLLNAQYSIKHGTGTEMNGVYVNGIQFIKRAQQAFEAVEDGDDDVFSTPTPKPQSISVPKDETDDLPF